MSAFLRSWSRSKRYRTSRSRPVGRTARSRPSGTKKTCCSKGAGALRCQSTSPSRGVEVRARQQRPVVAEEAEGDAERRPPAAEGGELPLRRQVQDEEPPAAAGTDLADRSGQGQRHLVGRQGRRAEGGRRVVRAGGRG